MLRIRIAAYLVALVISGCAPSLFYKAGATQQEFVSTKYACERDARQSGGFSGGLIGAIEQQQFFNRCMEAQGWNLQNKDERKSREASNIANANEVKVLIAQREACIKSAQNSEPDFSLIANYFSPTEKTGFTISQKANTSLATPGEAAVLVRYVERTDFCRSEYADSLNKLRPNSATFLKTAYASRSKILLQIIRRETTWGAAATQLEQEAETAEAKLTTIQG